MNLSLWRQYVCHFNSYIIFIDCVQDLDGEKRSKCPVENHQQQTIERVFLFLPIDFCVHSRTHRPIFTFKNNIVSLISGPSLQTTFILVNYSIIVASNIGIVFTI